jgi:glycosyltransferase involved in cell wall biosynthesis
VFVVSTAVQNDTKQRTGIESKIIYNGIELTEYQAQKNHDFNPDYEPFKIVQVSRLFPAQKGQYIAIQSIKLLKGQYPDIRFQLYFVGDGDALAELQNLTNQYDLQDRITFVGQVDRNWVKTQLQNYHVLIQPSLFEGFGLTVIEGFACGLPIIASNLDGPREICQLLNAGLLVSPNDPEDLAAKIYQIYQSYVNNTLKNSDYILQDKNRMKIFDIQTTAKSYMEHYLSYPTH